MEVKEQNQLCQISFCMNLIPKAIFTISVWLFHILDKYKFSTFESVATIASLIVDMYCVLTIIGTAIMIFVRYKYPKNKIGMLLMIYYIVDFVSVIIALFELYGETI